MTFSHLFCHLYMRHVFPVNRVSTGNPVYTLTVSSVTVVTRAVCVHLWGFCGLGTRCTLPVFLLWRLWIEFMSVISQNLCSLCVGVNLPATLCGWWTLIMPVLTFSSLCFVICVNMSTMCILWQWTTDVTSPVHCFVVVVFNARHVH